jgi:hypothetical protein
VIEELTVGERCSNDDIFRSMEVSNAGGIRPALHANGAVKRAVIMISVQDLHGAGENPYHDRLEGDILTYTAAGKTGEQTLSGSNSRLLEQRSSRAKAIQVSNSWICTCGKQERQICRPEALGVFRLA